MPRYYRKYTKTIVKSPKKPWNTGFTISNYDVLTFNGVNNCTCTTVCINNADSASPTPAVIKTKHIKVYGTICLAGNATESGPPTPVQVMSYIVYVPQIVYATIASASNDIALLYNVCSSLVIDHPEWIMSSKNVNVKYQGGLPGEHDVTKFTQTSGKMKRNLKSGDRICHIILLKNLTSIANYNRSLYFQYGFSTCYN